MGGEFSAVRTVVSYGVLSDDSRVGNSVVKSAPFSVSDVCFDGRKVVTADGCFDNSPIGVGGGYIGSCFDFPKVGVADGCFDGTSGSCSDGLTGNGTDV